jgi:hypothetical protein
MVKFDEKLFQPLQISDDQPLIDLSYYDYPSLSEEEGVWRFVSNYKLVDSKNHLTSLLIQPEDGEIYKLICTILPRPGNNKPRVKVVIDISSFAIDYSIHKQTKGLWLQGRGGLSWYKLIGNSDPSYESFVPGMNYMVGGVLDIYDSFYRYGITESLPRKKFTDPCQNRENKLKKALQIDKIYTNTMIINEKTNETTEGFSREFLARNHVFAFEHLKFNLLQDLQGILEKIITEFSINWIENNKLLEKENLLKEKDNKKRKSISPPSSPPSSSQRDSSHPKRASSPSPSSSPLNQLKDNNIKYIDDIVDYDTQEIKKVKNNEFSCHICKIIFNNISLYDMHCMSKSHRTKVISSTYEEVANLLPFQTCKTYQCNPCDLEFVKKDKFLNHIDSSKHKSLVGSEKVFKNQIPLLRCKFCSFSTGERELFRDHLKNEDHLSIIASLQQPAQLERMINNILVLKDDNLINKEKVSEKVSEKVQIEGLFFDEIKMESGNSSPRIAKNGPSSINVINNNNNNNNNIRVCTLCNYIGKQFDRHCMSRAHLNLVASSTHEIVAALPPRVTIKVYICGPCNLETCDRFHFSGHCETPRHKEKEGSEDVDVNQAPLLWCKLCNFSTEIRSTFYCHLQDKPHLDKLAISGPMQREKLDFIDLDDDYEDNNKNGKNIGNNDYEMKKEDDSDLFKYDDSPSSISKNSNNNIKKQPILLKKPNPPIKKLYDDSFEFDDNLLTNGKNFDKVVVVVNKDKKRLSSESKATLPIQQKNQLKKKETIKESTIINTLYSNKSSDEDFMSCSTYQPKRVSSVDDLINNATIIPISSFNSPVKKNLTINTNTNETLLLSTPINNYLLDAMVPIEKPFNPNKKIVKWKDMESVTDEMLCTYIKYDLLSPCQEEENVMKNFEEEDDEDEEFDFQERKKNKHKLSRPHFNK